MIRAAADRRGTSILEFAIVAPVMFMLVLAIIEFGFLMWTREALEQVAFAGARCMGVLSSSCASGGAVNATSTGTYINAVAAGWKITIPSGAIALNANTTCGNVSGFSQVALTYKYYAATASFVPGLAPYVTLKVQACYPNQPP